jgi:hypothetical protein
VFTLGPRRPGPAASRIAALPPDWSRRPGSGRSRPGPGRRPAEAFDANNLYNPSDATFNAWRLTIVQQTQNLIHVVADNNAR